MKKILLGIILGTILMSSCRNPHQPKGKEILIYQSQRWNIVRLNDTVCVIIPSYDAHEGDVPQTINLKNIQ